MLVTINDIKEKFSGLISGELSREDADRWAHKMIKFLDMESLEFNPNADKELIWSAIQYLYGIDTKISPNEYMHSLDDIRKTYDEKWNK